jgi:putative phosphoesterase
MKIVIVSDIHSNLAALRALPERDYDQLWCAGDLVDYGPRPREVIHEIQSRAAVVVSGNHDYAAGFSADPRCSAPYRRLAAETLRYTQQICSDEHLLFLRNLPRFQELAIGETRFYIVHATPTDPLFAYSPEGSDRWAGEAEAIQADVLVVGHTHTPFIRVVGSTTIVNPGSLGQPKTGRPLACYATWEDGDVSLKEYDYPIAETIRDIWEMPITEDDQHALIAVLETGTLPAKSLPGSGVYR